MGLNGRIPAALGHLAGLQSLVLDGNLLRGAIPPELGKLTDLEMLGLAANALTGAIPPELAKLSSLRDLWLSGNDLTGSLPSELRSVASWDALCPAVPALNPVCAPIVRSCWRAGTSSPATRGSTGASMSTSSPGGASPSAVRWNA